MSIQLIEERLLTYQPKTVLEQENALKEIAQEIALMALSRTDFFHVAAFQGGACLRILYGLARFSEDLDFTLENPDKNFAWEKYLKNMCEEFNTYGYNLELEDRANLEKSVKIAFLKANSIGGMLVLKDAKTNKLKLKIKLEIDTNPPTGSNYELKYLDFPLPYSVKTQDKPSLFAGKCHALLCRSYVKGRDWYDFLWYISQLVPINFTLLENAIKQMGPWQDQNITVTPEWFFTQLETKINIIPWEQAKQDVIRFLKPHEAITLDLWNKNFFLSRLEKLASYCGTN